MAPMQSLQHAKGPEDNWTGLRDRAERRRLQTRLNVRAHRRRKAAVTGQQQHDQVHQGNDMVAACRASDPVASVAGHLAARPGPGPTPLTPASTQYCLQRSSSSSQCCFHHPIFTDHIHPFPPPQAYQNFLPSSLCSSSSSPPQQHRLTSPFPLSRDHLIPLIEYNVYRASLTNIYILSLFSLLRNPSCMAILQPAPPLFPVHEDNNNNDNQNAAAAGVSTRSNNNDNIRNVPDSLLPTELQRTTPHELWIDILPSPRMRDNAIAAVREGRLVEDGICADVLRGMCGGVKKTGKRLQPLEEEDVEEEEQRRLRQGEEEEGPEARLIVWTNPWEAGGWEVTEGFVRKYGYLLKGCEDILGATNRYRRERGDDPLVWEVE